MRSRVKLIGILLLFAFCQQADAYIIQGRLKNYSPKWQNKIFLAAIRSVDYFESVSSSMQINEAAIDNEGNFKLQGNNLPEDLAFYRVYLAKTGDDGAQLLAGADHNFINLLVSNNSTISINADLQMQPIYEAQIGGSQSVTEFASFYKNIYYLGKQNYYSVYTQMHLNGQKTFELIESSVLKNNDPYYTIFALAHLNWTVKYADNKDFFESAVAKLKKQLPGNSYVLELDDKRMLAAFQTSPYKAWLNMRSFEILILLVVVLVLVVIFLLWRSRSKKPVNATALIPIDSLTQKELEIAKLIADGRSNKEISGLLFIEVSTVKSHVGNIYQKLGVTGRRELATKLNPS